MRARISVAKEWEDNKMLARIWNAITATVGDDVSGMVESGLWQWVPAHLSIEAVGQATAHNRNRLTIIDWRANRLVDALAKNCAATVAHEASTNELVASAETLVRHRLAQLAQATYRANNHDVTVLDAEGNWVTKTLRDSVSRPPHVRRKANRRTAIKFAKARRRTTDMVKPWTAPRPRNLMRDARKVRAAQRRAATATQTTDALN